MHALLRGSLLQRLRLGSGLVLFAFAATHFLNHALGLFGVDAMQALQDWRTAVTRSLPGSVLLFGALIVHVVLGLARIAQRRTWRMPAWEAAQIVTGLAIPILLFPHIVNTRVAHQVFGVFDDYAYELARLWPARAIPQSLLLLLVWVHGCIGIHQWLKFSRAYRIAVPALTVLAVLLPVAAIAGFAAGGRSIAALIADAGQLQALRQRTAWPSADIDATLASLRDLVQYAFIILVGCGAALLAAGRARRKSGAMMQVTYVAGPTVTAPVGATLLDVSRANGIPHASICGGRARCSTCRVRVELLGGGALPPPAAGEARTLAAIRANPDVRLACQLPVDQPMRVTRLLRPGSAGAHLANASEADSEGAERRLAVMFLDLRGFTALTEKQLPFDVVFLLNRFFDAIGEAILSEGGWIDKYMGDGLLAVFGREVGAEEGCRQALRAARKIDWAMDVVNQDMRPEMGRELDVAMGLHVGPLVIGRIGHPGSAALTVIGPTVNAASRLEGLTKDKHCQLVVSRELALTAGWSAEGFPVEDVAVRGFSDPIEVLLVDRARRIYVERHTTLAQPPSRTRPRQTR